VIDEDYLTASERAELERLRAIERAVLAYLDSPGRDDDYEELREAVLLNHRCEAVSSSSPSPGGAPPAGG